MQNANIAAAFLRHTSAINTISGRVGTLSTLTTTDRTSLVAALNELKTLVASSSGINDAATGTGSTWSSTKIQNQINAAVTAIINGSPASADTLKELADQIVALAQADNGLLSFTQTQTLTAAQQLQACTNLGIGDPATDFVAAIEATLASGL